MLSERKLLMVEKKEGKIKTIKRWAGGKVVACGRSKAAELQHDDCQDLWLSGISASLNHDALPSLAV